MRQALAMVVNPEAESVAFQRMLHGSSAPAQDHCWQAAP